MAGVKSLAVRGIRSFGPEDCDEQRISFERPLTLILGQNGCGKTTIIECLRYAITGQMPPGSRNECFVHDAKVNRSTEVLGQVKLEIVNGKDKELKVSRSMKVTAMAKNKTKFQTLDSFLSLIDEHGKTKDVSSRCADVDVFIHEQLGVSKAILNSVIFCHQEDSGWPLEEGKKVKERFDEIFDADKYSDCFDRLKKLRKEYEQSYKLLEQEVDHLKEKKEDLDKKKLDLLNTETRISESEAKVTELTDELKPISEKLSTIETLQKNRMTFEGKKEKMTVRLEHSQTQEQELKKSIKTIFEGTLAELQESISTYGTTAKTKQKELDDSYKKNSAFNKEEEKIANEKTTNEVKFNKLIFLESQNQERIDKRNNKIVETAKQAEIEVKDITNNEEAEEMMTKLAQRVKALRKDLNDEKVLADAEEKRLQSQVNESRDALTRHQQKISSKEGEIKKVKQDIVKVNKEIQDANESKLKVDALDQKISAADEEYRHAENELNTEECQKEINEDEKGTETHEKELEELNEKVTKLSAKLKERNMIEESLKSKEKQFTILKNKHRSAITDLLGSVPEKDFAMAINKYECEIRNEVETLKQKQKEQQLEITSLEAERKHVRESLNDRRTELTKAEDKMYKTCGTQSYDATLSKLTSNVEKLQEEQSVLQSSIFLIAKYKTQLKDNSCCPVCNRGFDSENDISDLISQMSNQVLNMPAKLDKVTEELQRTSAKKDDLLSLKSLNDKITTLKENDIPTLEKRLADIDKQKTTLNESADEIAMSLMEPEQKLQTAKELQGDMPLMDKYLQEIKTATIDLETVKTQCAELDTNMSLDDAKAKQTDLRHKINALRARIKSAQAKLNAHSKKLRQLADKKNKLKEQWLNLQKKVQDICNLETKKKELESNAEKFATELKELQEAVPTLKSELADMETNKKNVVNKNRSFIELKNDYIMNVVSAFDKVKSIDHEIKQHVEKNVPREMEKIKEANDKLMEKQKQIMEDRTVLTKKIDSLKDELAKQEIYKHDLDNNLKLRKAQTDKETCEKEIAEINEKLGALNMDVVSEKEPLIAQQTKIFREKAQTEGLLGELKDRLKQNKADLKKTQNKDIENKYRRKFHELHVTKAIEKDLKDYSAALDKCVMEFHKEKMENINLIIRELWRKIYRGNDIDYIEIKTEGGITKDSDRRKYDYRVVQCKNGVEIDMRGRCSAGQKVLACLIIRLALAETFSSKFGILALDEPTTNLDQENITSLCSALAEIVQERMNQKNFMFIIITHDKEFIESLGNIDKVTHYYEVSRNDDGKSRIKKVRFT